MTKIARKKATDKGFGAQLKLFIREGLREFVVTAGMTALEQLLEEERAALCGPRYRHDTKRTAFRAGHAPGELVMGGRRVSVKRPRVRSKDGHEVLLPSWAAFGHEDPLCERVVEQMMLGVSTRRYERSLEPLTPEVRTRGTSKSAVSRRFVTATEVTASDWLAQPLGELDLIAMLIDGVYIDEHVVLVALGIDTGGYKHVLGVRLGASENTTAARALLSDLQERGLRTDQPVLVVLDGAKALRKAVREVLGDSAILQRCQVHKIRNVTEHLAQHHRSRIAAVMRQAYRARNATRAKTLLQNLARTLEQNHPDAAGSLLEGLDETLTVMSLGLPPMLERLLSTTNAIENLIGCVRQRTHRVKRWKDGTMLLRWTVASVHASSKHFRRIRAYTHIPQLVAALRSHAAVAKKMKAA